MNKKITVIIVLQIIIFLLSIGCESSNKSIDNTSLNIADFYGEYKFY